MLGFLPDMSVCPSVNFGVNITCLKLAATSVYPYPVPAMVILVLCGKMCEWASKMLSITVITCNSLGKCLSVELSSLKTSQAYQRN